MSYFDSDTKIEWLFQKPYESHKDAVLIESHRGNILVDYGEDSHELAERIINCKCQEGREAALESEIARLRVHRLELINRIDLLVEINTSLMKKLQPEEYL